MTIETSFNSGENQEGEGGFKEETVRRLKAISPEQWLEGVRRVTERGRRVRGKGGDRTVFARTLDGVNPSLLSVRQSGEVVEEPSEKTS